MKKIRHFKTIICVALMVMALTVLGAIQKDVDADTETGSITVWLNELGTPKGEVGFTAYRVGYWDGSEAKWTLDKSLSKTGIVLDDLTSADAEELQEAAKTIIKDENFENLEVKFSGTTDSDGKLTFGNLTLGVYLIKQDSGEDSYGTAAPIFGTLPYFDEEDGSRRTDLTVRPKAEAPITEGSSKIVVTKRVGFMDPNLMEVIDLIPSNAVYYVGLFRDAQGTFSYGEDYIREIKIDGVSTETAVFDHLGEGTYYVFETDSDGNAYQVDDVQQGYPYTWVCQLENGSTQEIKLDGTANAPEGKVGFYNLYYDLPEGYAFKGNIKIEKKVLNKKGNSTETDDTFYAGIFRDEEATDLYREVELVQNGTVTTEVPLGGDNGQDPVTYYIYETDKNGVPVDEADFEFEISGEGSVNLEKVNLNGTISLTNKKKSTVSSGDSEETNDTGNSIKKTSTKKTGDDTPITFYLVIFVAAIAVMAVVIRSRSMKGRKKHE